MTSSNEPLVEARALTKVHPARGGAAALVAVDGIDFALQRGEAFGFLGPNGAGKSSTMRMVACVSPPTSGSLRMLGMDAATDGSAIRARIGVVPQDDTLDAALTVRENLVVYARYFGMSRAQAKERSQAALEFARLEDKADQRVETLSGGMRRRLTIARSLVNDPELLLLDEPTTGLDPQARHVLWERLFQLKNQGVTLILTTHYMDEAEQLCDRLVIMDGGRIVAEGSPRALIDAHVTREVLELRFSDADREKATETVTALPVGPLSQRVDVLPDRILVYADDGDEALAVIGAAGLEPMTALVRRSSLEDVFLTLTGRSLVE
ncbi:MAG: lipooligosaccharide transport system ATP-binding protein [Frankiaceae bacterium]|jgi:lipooligosaccharide transport system ATP-binding protein|nr:lipooligosaccharide transport system ATP-binding protein [Frankiaceae bacterium]